MSTHPFNEIRSVELLVGRTRTKQLKNKKNWIYARTYWAPSSPRPIGSRRTLTPSDSANVKVTGIDPPSRVRSGSCPYTACKKQLKNYFHW